MVLKKILVSLIPRITEEHQNNPTQLFLFFVLILTDNYNFKLMIMPT